MADVNYIGSTDLLYILNKIKTVLGGYVVKDGDKVLTDVNFTQALLTKLNGIAEGAEVNVQADWDQTNTSADDYIKNKPVVDASMSETSTNAVQNKIIKAAIDAALAAAKSYSDDAIDGLASVYVAKDGTKVLTDNNFTDELLTKLNGIAAGAEVNVQGDWEQTDSTADDFIKNKPIIDNAMSEASTNAVQNKIVKAAIDAALATAKTYTDDAVGAITGVDFDIVANLPDTGVKGVIYLVSNGGANPNSYDEYIWLSSSQTFEKIGTTDIDLTPYLKSADLKEIATSDIDTMFTTVFGA